MDTATADEVIERYATTHEFRYGDWAAMEQVLDPTLAEALFATWREDSDDPGFRQPSFSLVIDVEGYVGEEVWPEPDPLLADSGD
jgi:hypothetical protein